MRRSLKEITTVELVCYVPIYLNTEIYLRVVADEGFSRWWDTSPQIWGSKLLFLSFTSQNFLKMKIIEPVGAGVRL